MKAPREHRPHTPATSDPQRQPSGAAQRRVDDSARQRETGARDGGLPAQLRSGLEALSGLDMSDVRVHRNSSKPAQLEAAAYAQGRDIHLSPGQEHHLPHEAWHVVQQRQGRVRANTDVAGVPVNDHPTLEREADVMGGRAVQMKPVQRKICANPLQSAIGPSPQPVGWPRMTKPTLETVQKKNGGKRRAKSKRKEKEREAAIDRLNRGSSQTYSHLDPVVAANLNEMERQQPRKTAARKNIDSHPQRLREASPLSVVEAGAGEGRFSAAFANKFGSNYIASDIAKEKGPHGFLKVARKRGLRTKFGVNANDLASHFPFGSLDHVVGANPFGVKGTGGASYGLRVENSSDKSKNSWLPDDRLLSSVRPLLAPGGSVDIYGRSNVIRDGKLAEHPTRGLKGDALTRAGEKREEIRTKYPWENANPYLATKPDELHGVAKKTGYKVKVKRAKQPLHIGKGGNPDTKSGDKERAKVGLKPFNTRFTFTPEEEGYASGDDDPRVTYLSDDESDWED